MIYSGRQGVLLFVNTVSLLFDGLAIGSTFGPVSPSEGDRLMLF